MTKCILDGKKSNKIVFFSKGKGTLMSIHTVMEVHFWLCGNLFGILNLWHDYVNRGFSFFCEYDNLATMTAIELKRIFEYFQGINEE